MFGTRWLVTSAILCALIDGAVAQAPDPLTWLSALDNPQLDPSAAIQIEGQVVRIGPSIVRLDSGVLVPTRRIVDHIEEAVFVGNGRLQYAPPNEIERRQLELFAYAPHIDEPFEQIVVGGAGSRLEELFAPGAKPATSVPPEADSALQAWKSGAARGPREISERLLQARLDVSHAGGFSFAAADTKKLGKLLLWTDADDEQPFSFLHYRPIELNEWDKSEVKRAMRRHVKAGRSQGFDLDRLAVWDVWSQARLDDDIGGAALQTATSYAIDVTFDPGGEKISGTTNIRYVASANEGRVVRLSIHGDLNVTQLADSDGQPVPFRQKRGSIWAFLATPPTPGVAAELLASFRGTLFEKVAENQYRSWDTFQWHPQLRSSTTAEHEITAHWSPPLDVRLGGVKVAEEVEGQIHWLKHKSVGPSLCIFLEVGQFEDMQLTRGERTVSIAFSAQNKTWMTPDARKRVLEETHEILDWMEKRFGPIPSKNLTLIVVDQGYGQSLPGTIILPDIMLRQSTIALAWDIQDWRLFLAHEIAHQWWGNSVTPATSQDSWISEGIAEYLAQLYGRIHLYQELGKPYVPPTKHWLSKLEHTYVAPGVPVEAVGPIVLGQRLSSSKCPNCDDSIVYTKGALALEALGSYIGETGFLKMLTELSKRFAGKQLDSQTFVAAISKMSASDVSWFKKRYLEGTGMPLVLYEYSVEPVASGGYDVILDLRQEATSLYLEGISQNEQGKFEVFTKPVPRVKDVESAPLPVPVAIRVINPKEPPVDLPPTQTRMWRDTANWRLSTKTVLNGDHSTARIHTEFQVVEVLLDPDGRSLAKYECVTCYSKGTFRSAAARAFYGGRLDEAETLLTKALAAEYDGYPEPKDMGLRVRRRREAAYEDAAVYFLRAKIAVARGDLKTAQDLIRDGDSKFNVGDSWAGALRDEARAAIALAQEDYKKAYRLLWGALAGNDYPDTQHLLQMAIAAHHAGEVDAYEKAMRRAKRRYADVSLLEKVQPLRPSKEDDTED